MCVDIVVGFGVAGTWRASDLKRLTCIEAVNEMAVNRGQLAIEKIYRQGLSDASLPINETRSVYKCRVSYFSALLDTARLAL